MKKFEKPSKTPAEHVAIWKSRGLSVPNQKQAEHYLRFIGYYRLGGYCLPFQIPNDPDHTFKTGTSFETVLDLYTFDRELRLLTMDAVERVEVAFRTCVSNYMCNRHGPHWYTDWKHFRGGREGFFQKLIQIVVENSGCEVDGFKRRREPEPFLASYFAKYDQPKLPPSWMAAEVLSIADWSLIYEELDRREDRKTIAADFNLSAEVLQSWIHSVSYVRNLCAHHARLWNREFTIKPMIAERFRKDLTPNNRFYAQAFLLNQFMLTISPHTTWAKRLHDLFSKYPNVNTGSMGFSPDWEQNAAWQIG